MARESAVAVIGTGWGARVLAPAYAAAGLDPVLVGRDRNRTRERALSAGVAWAVDLKAIMNSEKIAMVHIATPPQSHAYLCEQALASGKNVVCEKPGGLLGHVDAIESKSKNNPAGWIAFGYELRFSPVLNQVKQVIMSECLGSIRKLKTYFLSGRYLQLPVTRSWRDEWSLGGGMLGAAGVHLVDLIRWLARTEVSVDRASIEWSSGRDSHGMDSRLEGCDVRASATMSLASGGIAEILVDGKYDGGRQFGLKVEFTAGRLVMTGESAFRIQRGTQSECVEVPAGTGSLRGDVFGSGTLSFCQAISIALSHKKSHAPIGSATPDDARAVHNSLHEILSLTRRF